MGIKKLFTIASFFVGLVFLSLEGFSQTGGAVYEVGPNMKRAKIHPVTTLLDNGKVVSFGGRELNFVSGTNSELYDPISNTFSETMMNFPHDGSAVVKLSDGRYFILGGAKDLGVAPGYSTTEMYDPATNTFEVKATLTMDRASMGAVQLKSGKVLVVGAWYNTNGAARGEIYNLESDYFERVGSLNQPRSYPFVIPTKDGGAVIAGGLPSYGGSYITQVEYYDAVNESFTTQSTQLIPSDSGWLMQLSGMRPLADCQMKDGRYLFLVNRSMPRLEYAFVAFDPDTKIFSKINTNVPLVDSLTDGGIYDFVLNKSDNLAYFLGADSGAVHPKLALVTVDLTTGIVYHPTTSYTLPDSQYLNPSLNYMPYNGKILLQGISYHNTGYYYATNKTYLLKPKIASGIDDISRTENVIYCYPNPANNQLNIEVQGNGFQRLEIELHDLMGRLIMHHNTELYGATSHIQTFNTSHLSEGLYKIVVSTESDVFVKSVFIGH